MIRLREGIEADAGGLFELDRICFPAGVAYSLRQFRWLLRSGKALCLIAEDDKTLAGFAIAQQTSIRKSPGGNIITIDVAPDFRRLGVGRLLMSRIEDRLRTVGAGWLRLEVAENNAAAREFYVGLGFFPLGRVSNYYAAGVDAIVMEKRLADRQPFIL